MEPVNRNTFSEQTRNLSDYGPSAEIGWFPCGQTLLTILDNQGLLTL